MEETKRPVGRPPLIPKNEQQRWHDTYAIDNLNHRAIRHINQLIDDGLFDRKHELAGYLLFSSCESRINACRYGIGIYVGVDCAWDTASQFLFDIINLLPDMWNQWIEISQQYYDAGYQLNHRPTIDRIDDKQGYNINNIQALSQADNTKKATSKPQYIFCIDDNTLDRYDTRQAALDFLGLAEVSDTGTIVTVEGKRYLLQSDKLTSGDTELQDEGWDDNLPTYTMAAPCLLQLPDGRYVTMDLTFDFQKMAMYLKQ